jgi:predicted CXXCH cytochrome family protein
MMSQWQVVIGKRLFSFRFVFHLIVMRLPKISFSLLALGLLIISCTKQSFTETDSSSVYQADEYVGEATCISCHSQEYNDWQGSHHDWAMKLPNDSTVLGDFNNVSFTANGDSYLFHKDDSTFFVTSIDRLGNKVKYQIAYTFGVTPLQQYLIKFPDGKYQTLRATWDTEKKQWFNQYKGQEILAGDWLHWTGGGQRWNTMCAECHSTNLKKNYNLDRDDFNTTYDIINVSCEACHGPAGAHVNWARQDEPTGNPQIEVLGAEQVEQLNQCAGCHARRVKLTEVMQAGVPFDDQYRLQTISSEYYHADGQIKEEDYVFGSFTQSKMFSKGVKCADCHNIHSMQLKQTGNALCMQCHVPQYDSEAHYFHDLGTEAAQCISCHMTGGLYMGNDFRRDHSFRVPRPDQSVEYDTPNACTGCHTDKSNKWAAEWVVNWYGKERSDHFSDHLLPASRPPYDAQTRKDVVNFINNINYPAISRATALEYYQLIGDEIDYNMLIAALEDSAAIVRYNALTKFQIFPLEQRLGLAMEHVADGMRQVRIGAAQLMIEQDLAELPPASRGAAIKAREELETMLQSNADFPVGRLQLGDYYFRRQMIEEAIKEYERAIKMDSLLTLVYSNLATAYNMVGKNGKALGALDQLLLLEPEYARGYYLRGLLYHEVGNDKMAINDLESAIKLDQLNFRAYYNLANLYFSASDLSNAEKTMVDGLRLEPNSADGLYLLNLIRTKPGSE